MAGLFDQNIQWGLLNENQDKLMGGLAALADSTGFSRAARTRKENDAIFGGQGSSQGQQGGQGSGLPQGPDLSPPGQPSTTQLVQVYRNRDSSEEDRSVAAMLLKQRLDQKKYDFITAGNQVLRADPSTGGIESVYTRPDQPVSPEDQAKLEYIRAQTEALRAKPTDPLEQAHQFKMRVLQEQGIDPRSEQGQAFLLGSSAARADNVPRQSPTELKAKWEAENRIPTINAMQQQLAEARQLNQMRMQGIGSGSGAAISAQPAFNWLQTDAQRRSGQATQRYNTVMSQQAIAQMAQQLKGATTELEMTRFLNLLADPNTTRENADVAIEQLMRLSEQEKYITAQRLRELGSNVSFDVPSQGGQPQPGGQFADPLGIR
jgi:hypothetical protein